ncbi:hypothetical protein K1719_011932 [Acacia pycnantha]|nr:hypothetical protein K1719_011932 [Acacia pycnantha]
MFVSSMMILQMKQKGRIFGLGIAIILVWSLLLEYQISFQTYETNCLTVLVGIAHQMSLFPPKIVISSFGSHASTPLDQ